MPVLLDDPADDVLVEDELALELLSDDRLASEEDDAVDESDAVLLSEPAELEVGMDDSTLAEDPLESEDEARLAGPDEEDVSWLDTAETDWLETVPPEDWNEDDEYPGRAGSSVSLSIARQPKIIP